MAKQLKMKRSEKIALWSIVVGLLVGIPLAMAAGAFGIFVGLLVAAGWFQISLKQEALTRVVDSKSLDAD